MSIRATIRIVRERERVLVADLGLAKAAAHGSGYTLTVGTPGYVAPEQFGRRWLDRRADVYSVGMLLHHLLTGVAPATDGSRPPPPAELRPEMPAAVEAVVRQATAVRPEDRFPSAGILADVLDAAMVAPGAPPGGLRGHPTPGAERRTSLA